MLKSDGEITTVSCDRCSGKITSFKGEGGKRLLESSLIQICTSCKSMLTPVHISAIKMRLKTGVIYSELKSGNDRQVEQVLAIS